MDLDLQGKVALVTAASKGIGFAVASTLAREGATVTISSRNVDGLNKAIDGVGEMSGKLRGVGADLSDVAATGELVQRVVDENGRLDILVLNLSLIHISEPTRL